MKINYSGKIYNIDNEKLIYILTKLEGEPPKSQDERELLKLMIKYELLDEIFLKNINKLW